MTELRAICEAEYRANLTGDIYVIVQTKPDACDAFECRRYNFAKWPVIHIIGRTRS